jgi:hypothetical protein
VGRGDGQLRRGAFASNSRSLGIAAIGGRAWGRLNGRRVPPLVTQIADGENGGVMMNEFPPKYLVVMRECSGSLTPAVSVTEYLEVLAGGDQPRGPSTFAAAVPASGLGAFRARRGT